MTALAWASLARLGWQMSAAMEYDAAMAAMGMDMRGPWGWADAGLTFLMWVVMMIGMMTPSAAPMLLLFSGTVAARQERGVPVSVLAFASGYLAVWTGFSVVATLAQWALHETAMLSAAMRTSNALVGGSILIAAGLYQLTPLKTACLTHCRSPLGFLMTGWRAGRAGAVRMGAHHGVYCLGCCWALMAVLFVVGVMSLLWVAILAAVVLLEKAGPRGLIVARAGGAVMVIAGMTLAVAGA